MSLAPEDVGPSWPSDAPWECDSCGNDGTWCGQELTVRVDHLDGDFDNNLPENLRLLCPNCHSQTSNFAGTSKGGQGEAKTATASI